MPLRGRVGRHANTGAQCQNWVEDQLIVIMLLNFIPAANGGAGGSIPTNHVVPGVASDALYNAILRFQKKHFPAQPSGFVEPGGPLLGRMEALAAQPTAAAPEPPQSAGPWGEFKSGSVQRALRKALIADSQLSHEKAADILYSTISNGTVSTSELADLQMVAQKSKTISPRSKKMLELFVDEATSKRRKYGPYTLTTSRQIGAAEIVCEFLKRTGRGRWPMLDRDEIGVGLLMRLAYPGLLRQGEASLCGPAAFLFGLLLDRPGFYAGFAIHLYERGTAVLGGLPVTPHDSVRQYAPPRSKDIHSVDWMTMASLRDSENWFFSYDTADKEFAGATTPFELVWWFTKAGYSDVKEDANLTRHQRDTDNIDDASRLFAAGYRVCLLIDSQMLETAHQAESGSALLADRHWIVLRSKIDHSGGNIKMTVFTWGEGNRQVPQTGTLPLSDFLENYYGYVAGKP